MAYNSGTDPTLAELITAKFVPEKFSKDVLMHTMSNLVVASRVNTVYRDDLRDGYKVSIPVMTEATDTEVTPGTVPTARDTASSPVSITVDQWREASVEISDMANIEDTVGYLDFAAKSCAYRVAKRVDTTLGALFSALSGGSIYGSDGQTLDDDAILAMMQGLDESDVPEDDRSMILDPSSKVDLLKIDKFVRNDYVRESAIPTGKFGNIYNMGVFITNNLTAATTGNYGVMMHRDALGLAIQRNPRSQIIRIPQEFRTLAMVDVIFGVAELRDTFGKAFYTRSS
tara:strand:- start:191 stop:1048 length:858 start_codon:yes stop_codon:yes gene_type:complete